jgi:vacuolar-type H+-ATPase subunit I/STV1
MAGKKIKKIALLFPRDEFGDILNDLIANDIIQVFEPELPLSDEKLESSIKQEIIDIEQYGANQDSLTLLGTETTLYLTGWIWAKSEKALSDIVSKYSCAWETSIPSPEELENTPIILSRPVFLYGFYKGHRDLFSPLGKKEDSDE